MDQQKPSKYNPVKDFEAERRNKFIALIIFFSSLLIFALTVIGVTDSISNHTSEFLLNHLGLTNKWSTSFGPEWFVGLNKNISALGGFPLLPIFFTIVVTYYYLCEESGRLWRLVFIVLGGVFLMLIVKLNFAVEIENIAFKLIIGSISSFPSGHSMMGTIFYGSLAVTISRIQHSRKTKMFILITGAIIIIFIMISRILPGIHTLNDVIAGWSLGLAWLSFCWILEKYFRKTRGLKKVYNTL